MTSASDRVLIIKLVNEAVQAGARQSKACEELGLTTRTLQRWIHPTAIGADRRPSVSRPAPKHKLTEAEELQIISTINQPEFASKPPGQIVPILADQGIYLASESSFYRVMRRHCQQNHRGKTHKPTNRPKSSHCATTCNQLWSWDITYLPGPIKGMYYYLYLILDIFSRDVVGWEVWEEESAEQASQLVRKAFMNQRLYGHQQPLVLHSDNGSPMKGSTMLATLYELGVTVSRSRPRVSNDNPYSESIFKTCKYRPNFPNNGFATLDAARQWCLQFVRWYRHEHRHSGISFVTPSQMHQGRANDILENRHRLYEEARAKNPLRWSRKTRDWSLPEKIWLNPAKNYPQDLRQLS